MKAAFILDPHAYNIVFSELVDAISNEGVTLHPQPLTSQSYINAAAPLSEVEAIFSGWGMPKVDEEFLKLCPKLKIIFYGAGTIKYFSTDAMWDRGIRVTCANYANAVPVMEYTVGQILLGTKHVYQNAVSMRSQTSLEVPPSAGNYQSTVGLISLGVIGKMVAEKLQHFEHLVIAYDPFASAEKAKQLNVELVSLEELFARSDVVSCHAPSLPETAKMLRYEHFSSMKKGATFLNTSRGAVVDEKGLIQALQERPDLIAVLDVTDPEPPERGSPFYELPNVMLTPHIAGSIGPECKRMGQAMVSELKNYLAGKPLAYEVKREQLSTMA